MKMEIFFASAVKYVIRFITYTFLINSYFHQLFPSTWYNVLSYYHEYMSPCERQSKYHKKKYEKLSER